jgi:hypothetical protein
MGAFGGVCFARGPVRETAGRIHGVRTGAASARPAGSYGKRNGGIALAGGSGWGRLDGVTCTLILRGWERKD